MTGLLLQWKQKRTSAQRQEASQKHLHVKTSVSQLYGLKDEGESTNTILNKSGVTHFATPHKKTAKT